jgi:predicted DNA binding protein
MKTVTLETANAIVGKLGQEIRKASASERKDAIYSGVDNPRWVIDLGCFKPKKAFKTISEAFRYICKSRFETLQETELTDRQRELVRRAVYDE